MAEVRKRGVAAAVICSDPFIRLGEAQAKVLGMPELPLIRIPHPLGGVSLEQVQGRALSAIPALTKLIEGLSG